MDKTIQIIESRIDLINKTTYLYDPQYCSKYNEDCSLKSVNIIGEFVPMKKPHDFMYGFKSNVHPLMNNPLIWKVVFIQDVRKS